MKKLKTVFLEALFALQLNGGYRARPERIMNNYRRFFSQQKSKYSRRMRAAVRREENVKLCTFPERKRTRLQITRSLLAGLWWFKSNDFNLNQYFFTATKPAQKVCRDFSRYPSFFQLKDVHCWEAIHKDLQRSRAARIQCFPMIFARPWVHLVGGLSTLRHPALGRHELL